MKRTLIVDTNLLVLLVVGSVRLDLIGKHRRTKGYGEADFRLLQELIGTDPALHLLPNVVTETSNLVAGYGEPDRAKLLRWLRTLIDRCDETYVPSRAACSLVEYVRLGLTDAAILAHRIDDRTIYTDDLDLFLAAQRRNLSCIYFTHEREARGIL